MSDWVRREKQIAAITLFVEDLDAVRLFYGEVFGLPIHFEDENSVVFRFAGTLINLLKVDAAKELIEPAVVAGSHSGHRFQFTLEVDDVDEVYQELRSKGIEFLVEPMDRWWGIRTASFRDPAGHIWEIAR